MSTNPFRDYAQFALQIREKERQRDLSPNRLRRPRGEMQQHVTDREIELHRHRAAALAAGRRTGHTQSEVERRVEALFDLCQRLLLWERDAPRLTADELLQLRQARFDATRQRKGQATTHHGPENRRPRARTNLVPAYHSSPQTTNDALVLFLCHRIRIGELE
jgi:hypothetical protein